MFEESIQEVQLLFTGRRKEKMGKGEIRKLTEKNTQWKKGMSTKTKTAC